MKDRKESKNRLNKEISKLRHQVNKLSKIKREYKKLQSTTIKSSNLFENTSALSSSINAHLDSVLEAATFVAIIATDINGIITIFNSGAEQMLGYKASEVIGKHSPILFHSESEINLRSKELN